MTSDLLSAMVAAARRSAAERERLVPSHDLERQAAIRTPGGSAFRETLRAPGIRVIAECKRRSPSRGVLRAAYDPVEIAREYDAAGAAAISVLTESSFFDGALDHLRAVRAALGLPLLCKDFIVTDFQVIEAGAAGADAVLLIVAALEDADLRRLLATAESHGLATLVEIHNREELTRALHAGATIIGVNSRNLRTLDMQPEIFDELIAEIPDDVVAVAESGLKSSDDVRRLKSAGYDAFLIGERFMAAPSPGAALAALRASAAEFGAST